MRSKKVGIFGKLIIVVNTVASFLLLISFVLPYLPPSNFPTLSILSLGVSPLLVLNIVLMVYWIFKFNRMALLSFTVLLIGFAIFDPIFEWSSESNAEEYSNSLSILSYNVHLFNAYEKEPSKGVSESIPKLLDRSKADIICVQEYYRESHFDFSAYPYQYIHFKDSNNKLGHAIFSKYPFANTGAFDFVDSNNNTLYADVVKGKDTIRIYNLHLQSMGIIPRVEYLQEENTDKLRKRMSRAFVMQEKQVEKILAHKTNSPYPVILSGDFNNTSFSYVYKELHRGMTDAFTERGLGIGTTYKFAWYPMRIDYILTSSDFKILSFDTFQESFSDHYPIQAKIGWTGVINSSQD